jgi:hypothetical protein
MSQLCHIDVPLRPATRVLNDPGHLANPAALAWEIRRRLANYRSDAAAQVSGSFGRRGAPVEIIVPAACDSPYYLCFCRGCDPARI